MEYQHFKNKLETVDCFRTNISSTNYINLTEYIITTLLS